MLLLLQKKSNQKRLSEPKSFDDIKDDAKRKEAETVYMQDVVDWLENRQLKFDELQQKANQFAGWQRVLDMEVDKNPQLQKLQDELNLKRDLWQARMTYTGFWDRCKQMNFDPKNLNCDEIESELERFHKVANRARNRLENNTVARIFRCFGG